MERDDLPNAGRWADGAGDYMHGVTMTSQTDVGPPNITQVSTSVIGLIAPCADTATAVVNKPYLITALKDAKTLFGAEKVKSDDPDNPMMSCLNAIFYQTKAVVVAVRQELDGDKKTPKAWSDADGSGVYALLKAPADLGETPKIIVAWSVETLDPTAAAMAKVAKTLNAVSLIQFPKEKTKYSEISAIVTTLQKSSRIYPIATWVKGTGSIGEVPAAMFAAGLFARVDSEKGFWVSPSNNEIFGIESLINPMSFSLVDPDTDSNRLNADGCGVIAKESGYRLWGPRSMASKSTDTQEAAHKFINVRRITDTLNESIARSTLWAIDRNVGKNFLAEVTESVAAYMRILRQNGAIIDGKIWVDPAINPASEIKDGKVTFSMDYTPAYPAENIRFRSTITNKYLEQIFK